MEEKSFTIALLEKLVANPKNRYQLHRSMWDFCPNKTHEEYALYLQECISELKQKGYVAEQGNSKSELTNPLELTELGRSLLNI